MCSDRCFTEWSAYVRAGIGGGNRVAGAGAGADGVF